MKLWPEGVLCRYFTLWFLILVSSLPVAYQKIITSALKSLYADVLKMWKGFCFSSICILWVQLSLKRWLFLLSVRYCHLPSKCVNSPSQMLLPIPSPWSGTLLQRKVWGKEKLFWITSPIFFSIVSDLSYWTQWFLWNFHLLQWLRGVSQEPRSTLLQSADLLPEGAFLFGSLLQLP